ncbi:MAG: S41 family peptidase, partial [Clostridia bacterium]|nr:S41 family peptidase [Clostridia bacterium]
GPAEAAGVLADDILTAVEGTSTAGIDIDATRDMVRGKEGTFVQMTFLRGSEELTLSVERRRIETAVAEWKMLEGHVGLVKIVNFDQRCAQETLQGIEELLDQGAEALIFDVRGNPGGYASEMVKILDYLLPEGDLFRTLDYSGRETLDKSDADFLDIPMVVIVNGESYSAAEFFAQALREYDAALVVGEKTCGKGYFQYTYELGDGSAVGLSVGKYFTPKGLSLAEVGVTPDVEIPMEAELWAEVYYGRVDPMEDPHILAALELLK